MNKKNPFNVADAITYEGCAGSVTGVNLPGDKTGALVRISYLDPGRGSMSKDVKPSELKMRETKKPK